MNTSEPIFISVQEAVAKTGLGRTVIFAKLANGEIASCLVGKRRLISHKSLIAWSNAQLAAANNK